jgi:hypothetical protein
MEMLVLSNGELQDIIVALFLDARNAWEVSIEGFHISLIS